MTTATATKKLSEYDTESFKYWWGNAVDNGCKHGKYRLNGYSIRKFVDGTKYGFLTARIYGKTAYCCDADGNYWSTNRTTALEETLKFGTPIVIID